MMLRYWIGDGAPNQHSIHDEGFENFEQLIPLLSRHLNAEISFYHYDPEIIRKELDEGRPVILRFAPNGPYTRHSVLIIGYDVMGFYVNDPDLAPAVYMSDGEVAEKFIGIIKARPK